MRCEGERCDLGLPVRGGQFVAHVQALPGNPYDGHSRAKVLPAIEKQIGNQPSRIIADAGYRGHKAPAAYRLKVYTQGQKRRVTQQIRRELKRRSAIEPVIGHLKSDHRMDRNYLAGRTGDAINAVLAAVGYNFRLLLTWLQLFCARILADILIGAAAPPLPKPPDAAQINTLVPRDPSLPLQSTPSSILHTRRN